MSDNESMASFLSDDTPSELEAFKKKSGGLTVGEVVVGVMGQAINKDNPQSSVPSFPGFADPGDGAQASTSTAAVSARTFPDPMTKFREGLQLQMEALQELRSPGTATRQLPAVRMDFPDDPLFLVGENSLSADEVAQLSEQERLDRAVVEYLAFQEVELKLERFASVHRSDFGVVSLSRKFNIPRTTLSSRINRRKRTHPE